MPERPQLTRAPWTWLVACVAAALLATLLPANTVATSSVFRPVANAQVASSHSTRNYGSTISLQVSQTASSTYRSYLRFDVSGVTRPVTSAVLRLYISNASTKAASVYLTSSQWTESAITWKNAPAAVGSSLAAVTVKTTGWAEVALPVTTIAGDGSYNLLLTLVSSDTAVFQSRRATNPPQLVVTGASSTPTPTPTLTPTSDSDAHPTPTPTPTLTPTPTPLRPPRATAA